MNELALEILDGLAAATEKPREWILERLLIAHMARHYAEKEKFRVGDGLLLPFLPKTENETELYNVLAQRFCVFTDTIVKMERIRRGYQLSAHDPQCAVEQQAKYEADYPEVPWTGIPANWTKDSKSSEE